jgi:hypothetical protein
VVVRGYGHRLGQDGGEQRAGNGFDVVPAEDAGRARVALDVLMERAAEDDVDTAAEADRVWDDDAVPGGEWPGVIFRWG